MIYNIYSIVHNIYVVFLDLCKLVFTYSSIPVAFFFGVMVSEPFAVADGWL